jgi:hypothetical protein
MKIEKDIASNFATVGAKIWCRSPRHYWCIVAESAFEVLG